MQSNVTDKIVSNFMYYANKSLKIINMNSILFRSTSPIDHIIDNIYLGDYRAADETSILREHGITHIINCAINLPEQHKDKFDYFSLKLRDNITQSLTEAIKISLDFIKKSQNENQNLIGEGKEDVQERKVFIHCRQGVSRSASIVLAYMILEKNMTYKEALEYLVAKRNVVKPNPFFEEQLKNLENK